jgi:MoxR-like ATPase
MKVLVGYPSEEEEFVIVSRVTGAMQAIARVATTEQLVALQARSRALYVDPTLIQFAVRIVAATRNPEPFGLTDLPRYITYGASPRASINMIEAGRALAFLRGREYVLPEDVIDVTPDVLRHRVSLSYEALSESITADQIVGDILRAVPAPEKPLESHVRIASAG